MLLQNLTTPRLEESKPTLSNGPTPENKIQRSLMVKARGRSPTASLEGFPTTTVFGAIGPIKVTDLTEAAIVAERRREKALLSPQVTC